MITVLEAVIEVSIETVLTLAFIAIVLGVNRTLHSYIQVATAILVTKNIVSAISIPVIGWLAVTHDWLSYLLLTGLMAWDFALIAYIMKKVLLIDNFASLIVAFFYLIGTFGIAYSLTSLIV